MRNLHPAARGQTLVLFALTLLLLVLMVCMTLSIGMKVRENHELQTLADAAAYSNAVVTARAYNNVSILNRLQVSAWVAQAGDQSYISWTSWARAAFTSAVKTANELASANANVCSNTYCCAVSGSPPTCSSYCPVEPGACTAASNAAALAAEIQAKYLELFPADETLWWAMDAAAGAESKAIQAFVAGLRKATQDITGANLQGADAVYNSPPDPSAINLRNVLGQATIAKRVMKSAEPGFRTGELKVDDDDGVNLRESVCNGFSSGTGACKIGGWSDMVLDAAMGTRLEYFTTGRGAVPTRLTEKFATLIRGTVTVSGPDGSGYWGVGRHDYGTSGTMAWADDHDGVVTVTVPPPGGILSMPSSAAWSRLRSNAEEYSSDQHDWDPSGLAHPDPESVVHTMGSCTPFCPSVWVWPVGFKHGPVNDANGQPKNYAIFERDSLAGGRTASTGGGTNAAWDPWNLLFRFRFSSAGQEFDNRGVRTSPQNGNLDISKSVAFGTGMAYYHRKNPDNALSWKEFPNFLNPFWRATLVRANIDAQSRDDIPDLLGGNWQGDTYRELLLVGFKGQH